MHNPKKVESNCGLLKDKYEDENMKVLLINSVCGIKSTGRICTDLAKKFDEAGHEVKIAYGRECVIEEYQNYAVRIGTDLDNKISAIHTRFTDKHGFANKKATKKFLAWAEEYHPDLLWLHNLHGYYINIELLFQWIKSHPEMQVKWTLHDCWAFTGHCSYFTAVKCEQWRKHCLYCLQKKEYPSSIIKDNCRKNFDRKKIAFTGVNNMILITPSQWLADLVKLSFLGEYSVEVHYNAIDTNVFKPTTGDFRKRYGLQDKIVVLGVASTWSKRKGLEDFIKLSTMLDDRYSIVLVGLSKKQERHVPEKIVKISRTDSAKELAEIYTAADVFVNLTYEDNYPTVNLEARACGKKVVTYNSGGSPESAGADAFIVESGDIVSIANEIMKEFGNK